MRSSSLRKIIGVLLVILVIVVGWLGYAQYNSYERGKRLQATERKLANQERRSRYENMVHELREETLRKIGSASNEYKNITKSNNPAIKRMNTQLKAAQFVGTAMVVKKGKIIYNRGYGYSNFSKNLKNTANSMFMINSVQKSMTGALIMQQVQAGNLSLTEKLSKFYPQVPGASKITIRNLLDMTSGLHLNAWPNYGTTEDEIADYVASHIANMYPLGTFHYEPGDYTLLSGILKKVTGESYYRLFNTNIVEKFKLQQTGFLPTFTQLPGGAIGYGGMPGVRDYQKKNRFTTQEITNELGVGDVYMSAGDLYKVEKGIITGKITSPQMAFTQITPVNSTGSYGGGFYRLPSLNGYYTHGLGNFYESTIVLSKDAKTAVVLMSNYHEATTMKVQSTEPIAKTTYEDILSQG